MYMTYKNDYKYIHIYIGEKIQGMSLDVSATAMQSSEDGPVTDQCCQPSCL